jgi:hypothetical protein
MIDVITICLTPHLIPKYSKGLAPTDIRGQQHPARAKMLKGRAKLKQLILK